MQGVGGFNLSQITNSSTPAQYQTRSSFPCRKSSSPRILNVSSNHISEQMQSQILIQKFMSQILDLYIGLIRTFSEKNCNIVFRKWQGGQRPFEIFPKIHPFRMPYPSLRILCFFVWFTSVCLVNRGFDFFAGITIQREIKTHEPKSTTATTFNAL